VVLGGGQLRVDRLRHVQAGGLGDAADPLAQALLGLRSLEQVERAALREGDDGRERLQLERGGELLVLEDVGLGEDPRAVGLCGEALEGVADLDALGDLVGPEGDDDERFEGAFEDLALDGPVGDVDRDDTGAARRTVLVRLGRLLLLLLRGGGEGAEVDASGES
jgi:hypothetical protein